MKNSAISEWPYYSEDEIAAAAEVLKSSRVNYWTGTQGKLFELEFARWIGAEHAVAVANGSVALQVALHAIGIGNGDDVVVPARTFVATASTVALAGARAVFADVDLNSQNITVQTIKDVVTPKTRAIICVHLAGWPCEMNEIMAYARRHNIFVIEDCAQAHGSMLHNKNVGTFGDIAAWSFCQDKIMSTAGEGGMVTTNSDQFYNHAWSMKDHGKNKGKLESLNGVNEFKWLHDSIGTNYRMTEIQSAIGRIQLKKLSQWSASRRQNAQRIRQAASDHPMFIVPDIPTYVTHGAYKCYLRVDPSKLNDGWDLKSIIEYLNEKGARCSFGICPEVYLEKAFYKNNTNKHRRLANSKLLGESSLQFLVHPTLTEPELNIICEAIQSVVSIAGHD